jgi:hypothetical protein
MRSWPQKSRDILNLKGTAYESRFKKCQEDVELKVAVDSKGSNLSRFNSDKNLDHGERLVYDILKEVAVGIDKKLEET